MPIDSLKDAIDKQLSKLPPTESYLLFIGTLFMILGREPNPNYDFSIRLIDNLGFWFWPAGLLFIWFGSVSIFLKIAWNIIRIWG